MSLTVDNGVSDLLFHFDHINRGLVPEIDFTSMEYWPEKLVLMG